MTKKTVRSGSQNGNNYTLKFNKPVGKKQASDSGGHAYHVTVVTRRGKIITAYPH
ncbi:hypothetical protein [Kitasatospora sp. NPDC094011]|uniref:hypothetical protein n=1 Tax=Kitasatospora sp. NPDC094011 TaxID=3364090 RepID=UPI003824B570